MQKAMFMKWYDKQIIEKTITTIEKDIGDLIPMKTLKTFILLSLWIEKCGGNNEKLVRRVKNSLSSWNINISVPSTSNEISEVIATLTSPKVYISVHSYLKRRSIVIYAVDAKCYVYEMA